jgi:hypothetical protein
MSIRSYSNSFSDIDARPRLPPALLPSGSAEHQTTGEESLASAKILLDSSVKERSKDFWRGGREVIERRGDEKLKRAGLSYESAAATPRLIGLNQPIAVRKELQRETVSRV